MPMPNTPNPLSARAERWQELTLQARRRLDHRVLDSVYQIRGVRYTLAQEWKTETRSWLVKLADGHPVAVEPWP